MPRAARQLGRLAERFAPEVLGRSAEQVERLRISICKTTFFATPTSLEREFVKLEDGARRGVVTIRFDDGPSRKGPSGRFWFLIHDLVHARQFLEGRLQNLRCDGRWRVGWTSRAGRTRLYAPTFPLERYERHGDRRERQIRAVSAYCPWESEAYRLADRYQRRCRLSQGF